MGYGSDEKTKTTFLLIDDDDENIGLLRELFERAGDCDVQAVADCQHAFDYLTGQGVYSDRERYPLPRLILMNLNGRSLEFLQWLRMGASQSLRSLPVTVLSSSGDMEAFETTRRLGVKSWFLRPTAPKAKALRTAPEVETLELEANPV